MTNVYIPEVQYNPRRHAEYFNTTKVGTLDVLGATLQETLYYNPTNALDRFLDMQFRRGTQGDIMTPDEYKDSVYYRDGLTAPENGIKEGYAQLLAENYDKRAAIKQTLSRCKGGFGLNAAQFGTMLAGSVLDPLNVASAFIPVFPAARYAHLVTRFGKTRARAIRGVVEGSVGATVVEPIVVGQAYLEQDADYNLMDSFLNVTFGGLLGGGLHVGFGKIADIIERRSPAAKDRALKTAITQSLNDQPVEVAGIINSDIQKNSNKNLKTQRDNVKFLDKAAKVEAQKVKPKTIDQVTRTGKTKLPPMLNVKKPKTLLQFIKENGKISSTDAQVSDLAQTLGANRSKKTGKFILNVGNTKGIVAENGVSLDVMAKKAQEAGFFHNKFDTDYGIDGATPRDLLDLLDAEQRGELVFSRNEMELADQYTSAQQKQEELDQLGIDYTNRTDEEVAEIESILQNAASDENVRFQSENMESFDVTSRTVDDSIDEANMKLAEERYNIGDLEEYEAQVKENAGIDDTFDINVRELELDKEIESLTLENEQTPTEFQSTEMNSLIKEADELVVRAEQTYDTATEVAKTCLFRNAK